MEARVVLLVAVTCYILLEGSVVLAVSVPYTTTTTKLPDHDFLQYQTEQGDRMVSEQVSGEANQVDRESEEIHRQRIHMHNELKQIHGQSEHVRRQTRQVHGLTTSSFLKCVSGNTRVPGIMESSSPTSRYILNVSTNFRFLQVSMKLGSCFENPIYRGNWFLTNVDIEQHTPQSQATMIITYEMLEDGTHTYHLEVDALGLHRTINTTIDCGEFQGFRVKTKGASVCELTWRENSLGVRVGQKKSKVRVSFSTLHELRRWANGAYVMAICFTLTTYILFLIAGRFQNRTEYKIVQERSVRAACVHIRTIAPNNMNIVMGEGIQTTS